MDLGGAGLSALPRSPQRAAPPKSASTQGPALALEPAGGNAFDIVCERKQTDFRKISSVVHEIEFEITLRNHKDTPIIVEVNEPLGGDWQMLQASHAWTKTAAWAAKFNVPVDPEGTAVLRYRTLVRW